MTFEIIFIYCLILGAMVLFATDWLPFDFVAMLVMVSLMVSGILSIKEGFSGFSNPATVTIAAMFALSKGIQNTGLISKSSKYLEKIEKLSLANTTLVIMILVGVVSAFINNTAAVVIFIPIIMTVSMHIKASPSRLLIPLSFASMFGGVCTLLGTSTNILVSSIAEENGLEPFGMFEFMPFGLIVTIAGFLYIYVVGTKIIPPRRKLDDMMSTYQTVDYLFDVIVCEGCSHLGRTAKELEDNLQMNIKIVMVYRDKTVLDDLQTVELEEGDHLRVRGNAEEIHKLIQDSEGLRVRPTTEWKDVDVARDDYELIEAVISPGSDYDGLTGEEIHFHGKYSATLLGVYHHGVPGKDSIDQITLNGGDSALLALRHERIKELKQDDNFVIVSSVDVEHFETSKMPVALAILTLVVAAAASNIMPIAMSACSGVILMVLTGCLNTPEVYKSINWKVIFLLAGVIPLGLAMHETGAAKLLSELLISSLGHLGPQAVLSAYFLLTTILTAMISNQATAALLATLAIETAVGMDVDPRPFLMAITFAASLSLITPWGYQTNTLIYGPGRYTFLDFARVGAPLNLLFWILGTIFIPLFWQF